MRVRALLAGAALALAVILALPALATAQTATATPTATAVATPTPVGTPAPAPTPTPASALPSADDTSITLGSTNPPLPVTVVLTGSQQAAADNPTFAIATYPAKGTLAPITAVSCTQTVPQSGGAASISCTAQARYTPVADAVGADSFTFTFENGGVASSPATVAVTLPSTATGSAPTATATPGATGTPAATGTPTGTATETPTGTATATPSGLGTFDRALTLTGVNAAIWQGGTVEQVEAAGAAAGATSITAYVNGQPVVLVVGAPAFVNTGFSLAFPGDAVPSNTVMLVTIL